MQTREAAFFDLDGTIVSFSSEKLFCWELYKEGLIPLSNLLLVLRAFLRYELGFVSNYDDLKRYIVSMVVRGHSRTSICKRAELYFRTRQRPGLHREALAEIEAHRAAGRRIYILSSSLDCVVEPVRDYLGVDSCFAACLQVGKDEYTGAIVGEILYGPGKGVKVRQLASMHGLSLNDCYAYGDSIQDASMLEHVGHPRAVNPDRKLRRLASKKGWPILSWHIDNQRSA